MKSWEDKREIEELLVLYSFLIDGKHFDRLGEVFTDDAEIDYTKAGGIAGSLAEIQAWLADALRPFQLVQHMLGNFMIRVDGDRATNTCYFHNPMGMAGADGKLSVFWCGGRYFDELVRTAHGWRLSKRAVELQYMQGTRA